MDYIAMQSEIDRLKEQLREKQDKIVARDEIIKELKADKRRLERQLEEVEAAEDEDRDDEDEDHKPLWDDHDRVYRCHDCYGEIDEDHCAFCRREYKPLEPTEYSCSTVSQAEHPDRSLTNRSSTPLFDVGHIRVPPKWEKDRAEEYRQLIQRGATPLMIDAFHLRFTNQGGIYAYADEWIRDEFAGEAIKPGDTWKIYLGRRIELDVEDHDGSEFIEGLLEDAVLFNSGLARWETVWEDGEWVTRPKEGLGGLLEVPEGEWVEGDGDATDEEDGEDGDEEGTEGDGGQGLVEDPKTWVRYNRYTTPYTGETIIENRYYDTSSDEEDAEEEEDEEYEEEEEEEDQPDSQPVPGCSLEGDPTESSGTAVIEGQADDDDDEGEWSSCNSAYDSEDPLSENEVNSLCDEFRNWYPSFRGGNI
ncbi:hypothetical protein CC1G_02201 [Coprinopsis cinerea okayama7|uniref:DUF8191 domain-containing protein n=1 Tax=Coprinopsis cinerea (strain Okayama-7 / 130 / ATCC MYA-4618 / FGSC 9003) TaxID=240176 RepID=A8NKJ1_COPC7|nr:hypothetical protein CC1G_02201 [Coprinopsis cinerea okayama7\|eukprot:XP_001834465.1 hypothetical protein CC1G_02201 [Coprinopsis cinerea okayama7\